MAAVVEEVKEDLRVDDDSGEEKDDPSDENTAPDQTNTDRKPRRELPPATVQILKNWMLSPEHVKHPYPTDDDKKMLLEKTGINMKQLTNWFTNARKRIWKPMMRRVHQQDPWDGNAPRNPAVPVGVGVQEPHMTNAQYAQQYEQSRYRDERMQPQGPGPEHLGSIPHGVPHAHHGSARTHAAPPGAPSPYAAMGQQYSGYMAPSYSSHNAHNAHNPYPFAEMHGRPHYGGYFPPRSGRSASESGVQFYDRYPAPAHGEFAGFPPRAGSATTSATPPQPPAAYSNGHAHPPLPPRLERSASASEVGAVPRTTPQKRERSEVDDAGNEDGSSKEGDGKDKRIRRNALLPPHVIKILKDWMMSPEHMEHPYPTDAEKKQLCDETGLDLCQLNNWFANNRKRLWKPTMANRSKASLYTNESIRNLIYKSEPNTSEAAPAGPSVEAPSNGLSNRTFTVNANLARPMKSLSMHMPQAPAEPAPQQPVQLPRYPFPTTSAATPREGRSHTLDMGHFRRSRMNFQDVLNASTNGSSFVRRDQASFMLPSLQQSSFTSS